METKNKPLENIHMIIHSLRLIQGYKPSPAEQKIAAVIVEEYKNKCDECKQKSLMPKTEAKSGFLDKILGGTNV